MNRASTKTVPCDGAARAARRAKAEEFLDGADRVGEDLVDAYVTLCVQAGIAAADVICCVRLGEHASGSDHSHAVALLARADRVAATALRQLLGMKSLAEYSSGSPSPAEARRAGRAATKLIEAARAVDR